MLLQSMGVDTEQLKGQIENAIQHVKQTDARLAVMEQALASVLTHLSQNMPNVAEQTRNKIDAGFDVTFAALERIEQHFQNLASHAEQHHARMTRQLHGIEDTLEKMRLGTPENSSEFMQHAAENLQPIEAHENGRRETAGNDPGNSDAT